MKRNPRWTTVLVLGLCLGSPAGAADCNGNGIFDGYDIAAGTSQDCNGNHVPDECDTLPVFQPHDYTLEVVEQVRAFDLDGDGDPDLVYERADAPALKWLENADGAGAFAPAVTIDGGPPERTCLAAGDLDGDGDRDLLTCTANDVRWYENLDGNGSFGPGMTVTPGVSDSTGVWAVDVDGDGDLDVVVRAPDVVSWFPNDGGGGFGAQQFVATAVGTEEVLHVADLDRDGGVDLLTGSTSDLTIRWYANLGNGGFGPAQIVAETEDSLPNSSLRLRQLFTFDVDGDGDEDVIAMVWFSYGGPVANYSTRLRWYANLDGQGGFAPSELIDSSSGHGSGPGLRVAGTTDLDADGDLDLMDTSYKAGWWENVEPSSAPWSRRVLGCPDGTTSPCGTVVHPSAVPVDLDGDGDVDLLQTTDDSSRTRWLENTGDDCDADTVPDVCELAGNDCDADGVLDACVIALEDCDGNGQPDRCDIVADPDSFPVECHPDCNQNGTADWEDVDAGVSVDCNGNAVPDECESDCNANEVADACDIVATTSQDCNANGVPDECDLPLGVSDCNVNGVIDDCDIAAGTSADCNGDAIPDECGIPPGVSDCNGNAVPDDCDIDAGAAEDCSLNGVLDECEPDCNGNGDADSCDIDNGVSNDCNLNGEPDECEGVPDCDGNGVIDECEPDCNQNGITDACDISSGASGDCQGNGVPDECEIGAGTSQDCNGSTVPDECELAQNDCNGNGVVDECETDVVYVPSTIAEGNLFASDIVTADVDGDGDLDVLHGGDDGVFWHRNLDGQGTFGALLPIETETVLNVRTADLDGDGDLDVVAGPRPSNKVAWYANLDGSGTFGPRDVIADSMSYSRVAVTDFDEDGTVDVVASDLSPDGLWLFANTQGSGTFADGVELAADWAIAVIPTDVDLDGDQDLVYAEATAYQYSSVVRWTENRGGTAAPPLNLAVTAGPIDGLGVGDIDGDMDPDVVISLRWDDIKWFDNQGGSGNFGAGQIVGSDVRARSIGVEDMDNDGDLDVIAASSTYHLVTLHENREPAGSFGSTLVVSDQLSYPDVVHAADVDGDGDLDILAAASSESVLLRAEPDDCNADTIPDDCQIDCNGNGVPDDCDTGCEIGCDTDGDGCEDPLDEAPTDATACADTDADGCDDCSGGGFDPDNDGAHSDGDAICDAGDCAPLDGSTWFIPQPVDTLRLSNEPPVSTLSWQPVSEPGSVQVVYDVLRSTAPGDFDPAACLGVDVQDTSVQELAQPGPGQGFSYLVRIRNACGSTVGTDSMGNPRQATCP